MQPLFYAAQPMRHEAQPMRYEAQPMRYEAQPMRYEAQSMRYEALRADSMLRSMFALASFAFLMISAPVFAGSANPCSMNPCSAQATNPCSMQHNPCSAQAVNPCSMNPCSAQATNPCSMQHNPCSMQAANPCSMNPCASQAKKPIREHAFENFAQAVALGKKMWNDEGLGGSGLSCQSCHADYELLHFDRNRNFPHYVPMVKDVVSLDQMINYCMLNPMQGKALDPNSKEMTAMAAYYRAYRMDYIREHRH